MGETSAKFGSLDTSDVSIGSASRPSFGENGVAWTLWLTYGAFYFCRTNISAAVPGLKSPLAAGGLGLSGDEVGWILASLKIAYGLGQLLNGQLSERFSPRVMLAISECSAPRRSTSCSASAPDSFFCCSSGRRMDFANRWGGPLACASPPTGYPNS